MRFGWPRERLRSSLWLVPAVFVLIAIGLAVLLVAVDRAAGSRHLPLSFSGSTDSARNMLSTIAASMITFTGLVFSITIVVLQLASGQFSPRVLRTFLRDRTSQYALGAFVSTFTFALVVLRAVRDDPPFVPRLSVAIAFVLVMVSVGVFVHYIDHISHAIRVANIVDAVGDETRRMIDRLYPAGELGVPDDRVEPPEGEEVELIVSPGPPGVLDSLDTHALVERAGASDSVVMVVPRIGDFVPEGAPLFRVYGHPLRLDADGVHAVVHLGRERTMEQDVPFGFRQLVDIAERALSPAVVDPTTGVQVIDQLHDLLRRLAVRPFPSGALRDGSGRVRVIVRSPTWDSYVSLAVNEIRHYGEGSIQVARRLRAMLVDVLTVAPPDRRPPLERQLRLLDPMVERSFADQEDRDAARVADAHGLG